MPNQQHTTPTSYFCKTQRKDVKVMRVAELLLEHGADVNCTTLIGATALHFAAEVSLTACR